MIALMWLQISVELWGMNLGREYVVCFDENKDSKDLKRLCFYFVGLTLEQKVVDSCQ